MPIICTFGALSDRAFGGIGGPNNVKSSILLGKNTIGSFAASVIDSTGNIIVILNNTAGYNIVKYNVTGSIIYSKLVAGPTIYDAAIDSTDNIYLSGKSANLFKIDSSGTQLWGFDYSGLHTDIFGVSSGITNVEVSTTNIYLSDGYSTLVVSTSGAVVSYRSGAMKKLTSANNIFGNTSSGAVGYISTNTTTNLSTTYPLITPFFIVQSPTVFTVSSIIISDYFVDSANSLYVVYEYNAVYTSGTVLPDRKYRAVQKIGGTYSKSVYVTSDILSSMYITVDASNNVYMTYNLNTDTTVIICTNSAGVQQWANKIVASSGNGFYPIRIDNKGTNLYITGSYGFIVLPVNGSISGTGNFSAAGVSYTYSAYTPTYGTTGTASYNTATSATTTVKSSTATSNAVSVIDGTAAITIASAS